MTPPRNPETQSLPLLHLSGVTFLWVSDALAVFEKGLPLDDIFKDTPWPLRTFDHLCYWSTVFTPNPQHLIVETSK